MSKWEYECSAVAGGWRSAEKAIKAECNRLGAQGWELDQVIGNPDKSSQLLLLFRRAQE